MAWVALRAPRERMQGAATKQIQQKYRRGVATPQTPRAAATLREHGGCGQMRRRSSLPMAPGIAASSLLACASQAPCSRPMPLLGRAPVTMERPARSSVPDDQDSPAHDFLPAAHGRETSRSPISPPQESRCDGFTAGEGT